MTDNIVRVRFAPSPTGHLHIGGARTALFNYLFARHHRGIFILRIEDTDRSRSTEEYIESIIEAMRWLKLDWDEGPYRQTDRLSIYRKYAEQLLNEGKAYKCYCTPEELERRRKEAVLEGRQPKYDGRCRNIKTPITDRPFAIRFKMPESGKTVVNDLIKGVVEFDNSQLEDLIIMRSDETPTYNFVVVVDDIDMRISHVIRGDDHLNNTPKQIHIYKAFNWEPPLFGHLPMILGADKTRLSKRHGATSVLAYKEMGYLPDALVNYLVRLGWSYGDQEIFTRDELIKYFGLENIGKSSAIFNPEKLLWLNSQYMMREKTEGLVDMVIPFLVKEGLIKDGESINRQWLSKAVNSLKERCKTLVELAKSMHYYISENITIEQPLKEKYLKPEKIKYISELYEILKDIEDFSALELEKVFRSFAEKQAIKLGDIAQPVRIALTGTIATPPLFDVMEIIGKERVLKRIQKIL